MTQEDKELLLRDLCARLPYSLCVQDEYGEIDYVNYHDVHFANYFDSILNGKVKPYLRPMSSMTEEEAKEIQEIIGNPDYACITIKTDGLELWLNFIDTDPTIWLDAIFEVQDYLNKNHFDYRGLIEKGLVIDATGLNIY